MNLERSCASAAHWTEQQYRQLFRHVSKHASEHVSENAFQSEDAKRLVLVADAPFHSPPDENAPGSSREILGFLVARHLTPEWELENLVVAPTARRQGLGRLLLRGLLEMAREAKGDAVFLEVRESNAAARRLYENANFALTGRRKGYYKDPVEDALLYRFSLV
jgi:[ribosomal protein S18]-alanine N-acetyltransferase